jgi:hypothetical protein
MPTSEGYEFRNCALVLATFARELSRPAYGSAGSVVEPNQSSALRVRGLSPLADVSPDEHYRGQSRQTQSAAVSLSGLARLRRPDPTSSDMAQSLP